MRIGIKSLKTLPQPEGCKSISPGVALSLTAVSALMSGAFPSNFGGIMFLALAIGLFTYVTVVSFNIIYPVIGAVISVGVAMLCGVKFPLCFVAVAFIPISLAMGAAIRKKAGLSATVAIGTIVTLAVAALVAGICYLTIKDSLMGAISAIWEGYEEAMRSAAAQMNKAAGEVVVTDTAIDSMIRSVLMMLLSVSVLFCMAMCYGAAKIFRLATIVSDSSEMFPGGKWPVSASLAGSVVFIASYLVMMFTFDSEIVYYSAVNILYIFLPSQAIVGFRLMFGKNSPIKLKAGWIKTLIIILCVYFVFYNPVMLLMLAASFASFYNIRLWLIARKKAREEEDDD